MMKSEPQIKRYEHVFITGSTGTGKTLIAKAYLSQYKNVMILDTKGTFLFEPFVTSDDYVIVEKFQELPRAANNFDKVVYRPVLQECNESFYNAFFKWCYYRKNTIVMVDEAMQVSPTSYKIPEFYKGILTRGRELNVSVWSLTQRPSGLNQLILTEPMHYYVFRLNHINDRKKIADITGQDEFLIKPSGHQFRYWRADREHTSIGQLKISQKEAI